MRWCHGQRFPRSHRRVATFMFEGGYSSRPVCMGVPEKLESRWRDHELGYVEPHGQNLTLDQAVETLSTAFAAALARIAASGSHVTCVKRIPAAAL